MPSNDVYWFKIDGELYVNFNESDLIDFDWEDFVRYDSGEELKIKARNVSFERNGQKDFKEYSEIPVCLLHSKGDAIALSPGGWRPLAFIPNGSVVLFDKNAFGTIKKHIDKSGSPQANSIKVVVDFFQNREITIDPKPILLEGNNRFDKRLPTADEMRQELEFFQNKMKARAPNLTVRATADSVQQLHSAAAQFFQGLEAILEFIDEAYRRYESGKGFPQTVDGFKEILALARSKNVQDVHLIFAAIVFKAISGPKHNPTLKLLKFNKPNFIEEGHSFNGALDIYSLFLLLSEIRNHGDNVYFVTADKDLIHLWNDMSRFIVVDDEPGVLNFDMNYFLPGLQQCEIDELEKLMCG